MKNTLIPLLLFAVILQSCNAGFWQVICTLGAGKSSIVGGSYVDPLGIQASIEPKLHEINKNSSLRAGLGFSYQGGNYKETEPDYSGTVRLGYINVPLFYSYTSDKGIYGEIGLQPAFVVLAKDKYKIGSTQYNDDYKYGVNKFDLGIPVGAGYQFKNGVGFGIRATFGILKVEKGSSESVRNLLVSALVSYRIKSNKKK